MSQEWYDTLRNHFSGLNRCTFLNSAGVAPVSEPVKAAINEWARLGECSSYFYDQIIGRCLSSSAAMVGGDPEDIFFCKNTTHGIQQFVLGYPWQKGDTVVLGECEFPANRIPWLGLINKGVHVKVIEAKGRKITLDDIASACDETTKVVTVSWVQYLSGYRIDLKKLGDFCRREGIMLVVDAIQGLGARPMKAQEWQIDWLSADSHKWLCGPEGIGIVYVSKESLETVCPPAKGWFALRHPFDFDVFDQDFAPGATRYNDGSPNTLGIMAMQAALDMLLQAGMDRISQRVEELASHIITLSKDRSFELLTPENPDERAGIVSFRPQKWNPHEVFNALKEKGVVCSLRSGWLRLSPHAFNTKDEIDKAFVVLDSLLSS